MSLDPVKVWDFDDTLRRIVERMQGHTIGSKDGPAWENFIGLLKLVTPYECGFSRTERPTAQGHIACPHCGQEFVP